MALMIRLRRLASPLLAAALLAATAGTARAGEVRVDVTALPGQTVQLHYRVPAGVTTLDRWQDDGAARHVWETLVHPAGGCARVEPGRLVFPAGCRDAVLRVTPASLNRDATYEAAQPVGGQGVLLHMSFYTATAAGHGLRWTWRPPRGGLVVREGEVAQRPVSVVIPAAQVTEARARPDSREAEEALQAKRHVYLGRAELRPLPGGVLVRDPTLDAAREQAIVDMLTVSLSQLRSAYGRALSGPVAVLPVAEDRPGFHGDTDGHRMMRLQVDRDAQRFGRLLPLQHFVAHEVAHWWNAGVFHSDPGRAWLHEGHAEWVALLLTHSAGLRSTQDVADELAQAATQCLDLRDDTPAVRLPAGRGRGMEAYACGLALWSLAQLQHGPQGGASPLAVLAGAHLQAGALLREADVARWADGGDRGPMNELLLSEQVGFRSGFTQRLGAWAQAHEPQNSAQLGTGQRMSIAQKLMSALMRSDCGGAQSFWVLNDALRTDTLPHCQHFQAGQELLRVEGLAVIDQALEAAQAAVDRCAAPGASLRIDLRSGEALALPCPGTPLARLTPTLWQLTPAAIQRLGLTP